MYARLISSALLGVESHLVQVETDLSSGLPGFHIVGLPDTAVGESVHRVRTALRAVGHPLPPKRCTVNLAPGDLRKEGPGFDLAIALGILAAGEAFPTEQMQGAVVLGELSLDGTVRPVRGVVGTALAMNSAGLKTIFVPPENAAEIASLPGLTVHPVAHLGELLEWLQGKRDRLAEVPPLRPRPAPQPPDLSQVSGQPMGIRALEIAATGGHHLLWIGPPGCGKTLLSQCLPGILPPLSQAEALEVAMLRSSLGERTRLCSIPPFAYPHSSITPVGLLGGHAPGEISRAHRGVLFLDELPEFSRACLEGLRVALEQGWLDIGRARQMYRYPARFQLLAACNPCPCGYFGVPDRACVCTELSRRSYLNRLSGPIRDRIDLQVQLVRPEPHQVWLKGTESSESVREKVARARRRSLQRGSLNRDLGRQHFLGPGEVTREAWDVLMTHAHDVQLSARAMERVLRVARTAADLFDAGPIEAGHVLEAIHFRCLDRWQDGPFALVGRAG